MIGSLRIGRHAVPLMDTTCGPNGKGQNLQSIHVCHTPSFRKAVRAINTQLECSCSDASAYSLPDASAKRSQYERTYSIGR